jgi:hypothetical protein
LSELATMVCTPSLRPRMPSEELTKRWTAKRTGEIPPPENAPLAPPNIAPAIPATTDTPTLVYMEEVRTTAMVFASSSSDETV